MLWHIIVLNCFSVLLKRFGGLPILKCLSIYMGMGVSNPACLGSDARWEMIRTSRKLVNMGENLYEGCEKDLME